MEIKIPELSLVLLVGASSSGKSTFAKKNFLPTEIISSDYCRALVSDDENSLEATGDAFDTLHYILSKRLKRGKLTVIDATNVQESSRKSLLKIAKEHHCLSVAMIIDTDEKEIFKRHNERSDRNFPVFIVKNQLLDLKRTMKSIKKEGISHIYNIKNPDDVNIVREKLWNDLRHEKGNFDIIGDIHGCFDELKELLEKLDYKIEKANDYYKVNHDENRRVIFLGDLVDRGPKSPEVLKLVMSMIEDKKAFCVMGNHDFKLLRKLNGKNVSITHGLQETLTQLENESEEFIEKTKMFINNLISHYVFDEGKLVTAHAGLKESMHGRGSGAVRSFCMYGETTGEIDEFGLPVRHNWASEYCGKPMVVYGHTPVLYPEWLNNTIDIDTGCVFGGMLTALRYPEREIVSVDAKQVYYEPTKPLNIVEITKYDDLIDIKKLTEKNIIETHLRKNILIREENSISALEVLSRFGVNPKWLIYLPPTMSPTESSSLENYLEHPFEALDYFRKNEIETVVCEEKHMGSRGIIICCKDKTVPLKRFLVDEESLGIIYTRTGRRFFNNNDIEQSVLENINKSLTESDFWNRFKTDWVIFDSEIMPWSIKAQELIKNQYSAVGSAAVNALKEVLPVIEKAKERGIDISTIQNDYTNKYNNAIKYKQSYENYSKKAESIDDYKIAPFHILATENQMHTDKTHIWHMEEIKKICDSQNINDKSNLLMMTDYKVINLYDDAQIKELVTWWENMTSKGGEGMVIKPLNYITYKIDQLIQPAIKCRGKEYLRIIYGIDYTNVENLNRLKNRAVNRKRRLALNEFILGLESLKRFVERSSISRVHECSFGVLAMESNYIDPRL